MVGITTVLMLALASGAIGWGMKPSTTVESGATVIDQPLGGILGDNPLTDMMPFLLLMMLMGSGGLGGGEGSSQSSPTYIYYDDEGSRAR